MSRQLHYCLIVLPAILFASAATAGGGEWTMRLDLRGRRIEATPVFVSEKQVLVLGRDGQFWQFAPEKAENFSKLSDRFRPYSQSEVRGQLLRQFGRSFDVTGTGHYLVVHPAGQRDLWAGRFEELYRSFAHYFTARGFRPSSPRFPLVAVVFHKKQDFIRHAAADGMKVGTGVLGYYSPRTNRIVMYDRTDGRGNGGQWHVNADTIIHEATHQTACNTGIHRRMAPTPYWVAEGLATMFEAPGVWDSQRHPQLAQRINRYRLVAFQQYVATQRKPRSLATFVSSDRPFKTNGAAAYAEAWALTFYLVETQPREYFQYLAKTSSRPELKSYSGKDRLKDFTDVFGADLTMLEARFLRFIGSQ